MEILAHTQRLTIRTWNEEDILPYAEIVADPEVMKHIGEGSPRGRDYAERFVHRMIELSETRGWIRFAVQHTESSKLIGFCGFDSDSTSDSDSDDNSGAVQDFGWRYAREFWGAGYGSEAALCVLELGRTRYGLTNIQSRSYPENFGSLKLFEKLGMSFLGESEEFGRKVVNYGFPDLPADRD